MNIVVVCSVVRVSLRERNLALACLIRVISVFHMPKFNQVRCLRAKLFYRVTNFSDKFLKTFNWLSVVIHSNKNFVRVYHLSGANEAIAI